MIQSNIEHYSLRGHEVSWRTMIQSNKEHYSLRGHEVSWRTMIQSNIEHYSLRGHEVSWRTRIQSNIENYSLRGHEVSWRTRIQSNIEHYSLMLQACFRAKTDGMCGLACPVLLHIEPRVCTITSAPHYFITSWTHSDKLAPPHYIIITSFNSL